ncbi:MAG: tetratricopeptide repeat protein [Cyclobacteriaceae bacterium]
MRFIYSLLLFFVFNSLFAQDDISFDYEDLKSLSFSYPDSVIAITKEILANSSSNESERNFAIALQSIAYRNKSDFETAIRLADQLLGNNPEESLQAAANHNKGVSYRYLGEYDSAIRSNLRALSLYEKLGQQKEQAVVLNSLGVVNMRSGDYDRALEHFRKTAQMSTDLNDLDNLSDVLNNMAIIFAYTDKIDSSELYFREGLNLEIDLNNLKGMSAGYNNLGELKVMRGDLDSAIIYLQKSLQIDKQMEDTQGLAAVMNNIAGVAIENGNYPLAQAYLDSSMTLSRQSGSKRDLEMSYLVKSDIYETNGNYREAFQNLKNAKTYGDSLINEERTKAIAELETKYETEKKEQEIAIQQLQLAEKDLTIERNIFMQTAMGVFIAALIGLAFLQRSRQKHKEQALIAEEKRKMQASQIDAVIRSIEQERKRFSEDLHDGFGQYLSILRMNIDSIQSKKEQPMGERVKLFEHSENILKEMGVELKNICFNLMPKTLVQHGIDAALKEFGLKINQAGKVKIDIITHGFDESNRLTEVQEISFYRICQEWVNNILKYGQASQITLQLLKDDEEISLTIEDNGPGFDPQVLEQGKGNGWKNIQSRANLVNAGLELDTRVGSQGSTLMLNVELAKTEKMASTQYA